MESAVKIIGYIFCTIFLGGLAILVVMMSINEFRRFFSSRNKKKNKRIDKDVRCNDE